jgi:uncharacterized protein (DUF2147 family)
MDRWLTAVASVALLTVLAGAPPACAEAADGDTPVGLWKTVDDKTGAVTALIRITEAGGVYSGHIEQSFRPGAATRVCDVCSDDRRNKPILGLEIIRGIRRHDADFSGGEILDPDNGSVYRCKLRLEEGGRKLIVRGYIGISLLGRSQTWTREP